MEPKKILIILSLVFVMSTAAACMGIAYAGGVTGIGLLGALFFLTFGILVVLAQLIPAGIPLSAFIGTAVSPTRKAEMPVRVM